MKPLHIEFTGNRSRRLAALGGALGVMLLLVALGAFWHGRQEHARLSEARRALELRLEALNKPPPADLAPASPAWLKEADASLRQDWNQVMGMLEDIEFPGVHLQSLQVGVLPETARVEYQLDSWQRVAEMTEALNQRENAAEARWILLSVGASASGVAGGGSGVRAAWERSRQR